MFSIIKKYKDSVLIYNEIWPTYDVLGVESDDHCHALLPVLLAQSIGWRNRKEMNMHVYDIYACINV